MKVVERIGLHTGHFNVEASHFAELVRDFWSRVQGNRERYITSKENFMLKKKGYDNVNNKDYGAGMH